MAGAESASLEQTFQAFSKFGNSRSDGKQVTLSQIDKWLKQAAVLDGKKLSTTDTGIAFNRVGRGSKTMKYDDFLRFVDDLAASKKIDPKVIKDKLAATSTPGTTNTTQTTKVGAVDRLTDPSKYTGAHKERFDESGKGKGIEGREDVKDKAGYVQGYKEKDTYDKTHGEK